MDKKEKDGGEAWKQKNWGEFISQKRKEKQITQKELAKCLHVTDKAVSRWERGFEISGYQYS